MKKVFRGLKGISVAALTSSLLLSLGVSANITGTSIGSVDMGDATSITNVKDALAVTPFKAKLPTTVADGCWVYINGYWIRVCNHDEPPVKTL